MSNELIQLALALGPFALLIASLVIRATVITQDETISNAPFRKVLKTTSFVLLGISCISMLVISCSGGAMGLIGLVITGTSVVSIIQSEIQAAGVRHRTQQAELLWALALAVKSGRPLDEEVAAYAAGTTGKRRTRLNLFAERLGEGRPLTEIVVPQNLLPDSALMQIHSGIVSDSLEQSLTKSAMRLTRQLAEERETEFTGSGLIYPPALICIGSMIVFFVMYYIIPKFKKIFDDFGTDLPESTIGLIRVSDFVVNYWYAIGFPIFIGLPIAACTLVAYAEFYGWHTFWRMTFGHWLTRCHTPNLLRALSQSISHQIPISHVVTELSHHSNTRQFRKRLSLVMNRLDQGEDNWMSFRSTGFLTSNEAALLQAAERANNLPWALDMLATTIEERQLFRIRSALEIIQPLLLIPLGMIIGVICIALFLPLVKLLNDLS